MNNNILKIRQQFQRIDAKQFTKMLEDQAFDQISSEELNVIFLSVDNEKKKEMLMDFFLFEKIISLPPNRLKKEILELVDDEIREYIFASDYLKASKIAQEKVKKYLQKLPLSNFYQYLEHKNLNESIEIDVFMEVQSKYHLNSYLSGMLENSIANYQFSPLSLLQIQNEWELLIYAKFQVLLSLKNTDTDFIIISGKELSKTYLQEVSRRHIVSLIEIAKRKEGDFSVEELFVGVVKMYMALGYDSSKKVLEDYFTYATSASEKRASYALAKDLRRQYRLENQDKYYYHGIEYQLYHALEKNDISFFEKFCGDDLKQNAIPFMNNLRKIKEIYPRKVQFEQATNLITQVIREREEYYLKKDVLKYMKHYQMTKRKDPIGIKYIYFLFSDIDLPYVIGKQGKIVPDASFVQFLLGNSKRDNDCLLRMVLNKEALGLNEELPTILNHYSEIVEEILKKQQENKHLSIYSILDIIDISKVLLYQLKPNETGISLDALSKILNSRKYCTEPPEEVLRRTLALHKEGKKRIQSAIPFLSGEFEGLRYQLTFPEVVDGINSGSCFKVGGKGEDFLRFCITDPCGMAFYIKTEDTRYVLPATVNGNMLNINSIDPIITDESLFIRVISLLKEVGCQIIQRGDCDIEMITVTDVHHQELMKKMNFESLVFKEFIPLGTTCYSDYMKKDVTNYILSKKDRETKDKYYLNSKRFLFPRKQPYIFTPSEEMDQERLNLTINDIYYTKLENSSEKIDVEYYIPLEVKDFVYIIGSKDWFIGITHENAIISACLPYDSRAESEYTNAYHYIKTMQPKNFTFQKKEKYS